MSRRYTPSPRPTFDVPTHVRRDAATRYLWGDGEAGTVADRIYVSSGEIHALVFQLAPGGAFRHSAEFRTIFGADEVLHVLRGTMFVANPETGEVQRVETGQNVFFRKDTWHHAFAHGTEPLEVLELFAPPPSAGASGAYARTKPYLEESRYADDDALGRLPGGWSPPRSFTVLDERDVVWRLDLGVAVGVLASTEHLTVHLLEIGPGQASAEHAHDGDEVLYVLEGTLWVRAAAGETSYVFEAEAGDVVYVPRGAVHEYRGYERDVARALVGVAPRFTP